MRHVLFAVAVLLLAAPAASAQCPGGVCPQPGGFSGYGPAAFAGPAPAWSPGWGGAPAYGQQWGYSGGFQAGPFLTANYGPPLVQGYGYGAPAALAGYFELPPQQGLYICGPSGCYPVQLGRVAVGRQQYGYPAAGYAPRVGLRVDFAAGRARCGY